MAPADQSLEAIAGPVAWALTVEVVVGLRPGSVHCVSVKLPEGATVRQALDAADVWSLDATIGLDAIESGQWTIGVWGRKEGLAHALRDHDRIELVRPLIVDPKEARRVRYRAHGEKLPKGFHRPKAR